MLCIQVLGGCADKASGILFLLGWGSCNVRRLFWQGKHTRPVMLLCGWLTHVTCYAALWVAYTRDMLRCSVGGIHTWHVTLLCGWLTHMTCYAALWVAYTPDMLRCSVGGWLCWNVILPFTCTRSLSLSRAVLDVSAFDSMSVMTHSVYSEIDTWENIYPSPPLLRLVESLCL